MLYLHPLFQLSAIILGWYTLYLGVQRFRILHLHQKVRFQWSRHVTLGLISLVTLLAGMGVGMLMVYTHWQGFLMTGTHGKVAMVMAPMILFGLITGLVMNVKKKPRQVLPLIHGINNLILLLLALSQAVTGWGILKTFVMGL